jgi:hypothetical protein
MEDRTVCDRCCQKVPTVLHNGRYLCPACALQAPNWPHPAQCADCTRDLIDQYRSWTDRTRCRDCANARRTAA